MKNESTIPHRDMYIRGSMDNNAVWTWNFPIYRLGKHLFFMPFIKNNGGGEYRFKSRSLLQFKKKKLKFKIIVNGSNLF